MLSYDERKQAAREKKEREEAEVKALFPQVVKAIAAAMGYSARFHYKSGEAMTRCYAVIENGARGISLTTSDYSPDFRLSISGEYNMGPSELGISWPYGTPRPGITVSMRRDAAAIAKEINSRFLPDYDAACTKIAGHIKQASDSLNSRRSTRDRLAAMAGVKVRQYEHRDEQFEFSKYYGKEAATGPRLEVKASTASATVSIDCSVELAAAVIKAIEALATCPNPSWYSIQRSFWSNEPDEIGTARRRAAAELGIPVPAEADPNDHEGEYLNWKDDEE